MSWDEQAACLGQDPEFWCEPATNQAREYAKTVCRRCPVSAQCLEDTPVWDVWTIRGGLTGWERARIREIENELGVHGGGQ